MILYDAAFTWTKGQNHPAEEKHRNVSQTLQFSVVIFTIKY